MGSCLQFIGYLAFFSACGGFIASVVVPDWLRVTLEDDLISNYSVLEDDEILGSNFSVNPFSVEERLKNQYFGLTFAFEETNHGNTILKLGVLSICREICSWHWFTSVKVLQMLLTFTFFFVANALLARLLLIMGKFQRSRIILLRTGIMELVAGGILISVSIAYAMYFSTLASHLNIGFCQCIAVFAGLGFILSGACYIRKAQNLRHLESQRERISKQRTDSHSLPGGRSISRQTAKSSHSTDLADWDQTLPPPPPRKHRSPQRKFDYRGNRL